MTIRKSLLVLVVALTLGLLALGVYWQRALWLGWLQPPSGVAATEHPAHQHENAVHLNAQAQATLKLKVAPIRPETYWKTISIPGAVVELPGRSDQLVATPVAGVVTRIVPTAGEVVRPGQELFRVRLLGEHVQKSQAELLRTMREQEITAAELKRLRQVANVVARTKILDLEYQQRRLQATEQSLRYDLRARGLTTEQIDQAAQGNFLTTISIAAPENPESDSLASETPPLQVEELQVQIGDQVPAGKTLCTLARHDTLYLEGRAYKHEIPLVERAARAGWPLQAHFPEEVEKNWPPLSNPLEIQFLGGKVDQESQTVPVYVRLSNMHRLIEKDGRTLLVWRFRPVQRVYLRIPVERLEEVFVLPVAAVASAGVDNYVFRQNGELFERLPVQVRYRDREHVIVANDGSVWSGEHLVMNRAAQLLRALRTQLAPAGGHQHSHAGHMH